MPDDISPQTSLRRVDTHHRTTIVCGYGKQDHLEHEFIHVGPVKVLGVEDAVLEEAEERRLPVV